MNIKRITALILIIVFVFAILTSCNSKKEIHQKAEVEYTNVYKTQYLEIPEGYFYNNSIVIDDSIYILLHKMVLKDEKSELDYFENILYIYNIKGEFIEKIDLNSDIFKHNYDFILSKNKTFYIADESKISNITLDGTIIWEMNYKETFNLEKLGRKIATYIDYDTNYVYIMLNSVLLVITTEGEPVHYFKISDYIKNSPPIININKIPNGEIIITCQGNNYYSVDVDNKKITEYELPSIPDIPAYMTTYYDANNSNEYDIYYKNNDGLFGYNFENKQTELLVNWTNSDIFGLYCDILSIITPDVVLCTLRETLDRKKLSLLIRIPDDEVIAKTIITIADVTNSQLLMSRVVMFNRQSDNYRVVIDNGNNATEFFNLDIVSGVIHDMVFLSNSMPIDSYVKKGMFADFHNFFDSDPDVSRDILLGMLKSKYETDGNLYTLPLAYYVVTLLSKQSMAGTKENLTIDEIMKINENLSPEMSLFTYSNRDSVFSYMLQAGASEYIDYKNAKCSFTDDNFIKMIEFAKTLPDTALTTKYNLDERENMDVIRNNQSYFYDFRIFEMLQFILMNFYYGDDDYVIKGFPSQTGNGTIVECYNYIGINSKSENQMGAWEFVKYWLLNESELDSLQMTTLPVTNAALQKLLDKYINKYYYWMHSGFGMYDEPLSTDEISKNNYGEYHFTEENATKILRFFNNLHVTPKYDNTVIGIILEEITPFFANKITAEQCAKYIQNRVSTYLNEQK